MKAALHDFLRFCIVLVGTVFFMNADVLNRYSNTCVLTKKGETNSRSSFLSEAESFQEQHALLPAPETEHRIQEESRSAERPTISARESNRGFYSSLLPGKITPDKNNFLLTACTVPIYLLVRSLRI